MSFYTFPIPLNAIRAARTHAADNDVRHYLCGIYVDLRRGKIVGTDGHRLFVGDIPAYDSASFIIRNETIDAALKQFGKNYARGKDAATECVQVTTNGIQVSIQTPIGTVTGTAIDATYPNYLNVIPKSVPDTLAPSGINGRYVYEAFEALATYRNRKARGGYGAILSTNGNNSAVVSDGLGGALCVIMPMRIDVEYNNTNNALNGFFRSLDPLAQEVANAA